MDLEDGRYGTHAGLESEVGGIEKARFSCKIIEDISV